MKLQTLRISFEGNLGKNTITPRGIKSELVGQLVKVQGIITSTSQIKPKLIQSTHFNEHTAQFSRFNYVDQIPLK